MSTLRDALVEALVQDIEGEADDPRILAPGVAASLLADPRMAAIAEQAEIGAAVARLPVGSSVIRHHEAGDRAWGVMGPDRQGVSYGPTLPAALAALKDTTDD